MSIAKDFLCMFVFLALIIIFYLSGNNFILPILLLSAVVITYINKYYNLKNRLIEQREYFINTLSHDLRVSTLAQIRGLEILVKRLGCEDDIALITDINNSCKYTLDMITTLLNTFRYENNELILVHEKLDIEELISSCMSIISNFTSSKSIQLCLCARNKSKFFIADRYSMEKLFTNLLLAAVSYSEENGKIYINVTKNSNNITFEITYKGTQLSEEERRRMFSKNSKFSAVGHGIRMHLCKKIIEFHGGKINVSCKNGNTNTFSFNIPQKKEPVPAKTLCNSISQNFIF